MATTNLFALHAGKDGSPAKALSRIIGYIDDPTKTEKDELITANECEPRLMNTGSYAQLLPEWLLNSLRKPCSVRFGQGAQQGADSPTSTTGG